MFVLAEFTDIVKINPSLFSEDLEKSIIDALNNKLANKVIPNIGLCIVLFDVLNIGDSFIFPGEGGHHTNVRYRFVVFRPFTNEVLIGKIKGCSQEGIQITLGFFDDIQIPSALLPHPSKFHEEEQVWVWVFDNQGQKFNFSMDIGEKVKFRVVSEIFMETSPEGKIGENKVIPENKIPYLLYVGVFGSLNEPGLGVLSWWEGQ